MARAPQRKRLTKKALEEAQVAYGQLKPKAVKLIECLRDQLTVIIANEDIFLGVPIESRIK